jgi:tellurium resistance protein TerZ
MISLEKGSRLSLAKEDGTKLTSISMGLGWDGARGFLGGAKSIDLDASCLLLNADKQLVEEVSFRNLQSRCRSIQHSGDNRTGAGDGDDETIKVNLASLPANVNYLIFTVNSFTGQSFQDVENAKCRVYDDKGQAQAQYVLSDKGSHTGMIMVSVYRHGDDWKVRAIGHQTSGRVAQDMMRDIAAVI